MVARKLLQLQSPGCATRPARTGLSQDVPADFPKVAVPVHELGAETPLQHMAAPLMSPIEPLRVHTVQLSHCDREIRRGCLDQQVVVIAHEAIGVTEHAIAGDSGCQHDEEPRAVIIVFEDRAPSIPTRSNVVDSAGKLEPERPGHGVHTTAPASVRSSVTVRAHPLPENVGM